MSLDPIASANSIARIRNMATRILPGHDGWITIEKDGILRPEGKNDVTFVFGQGITVNGGKDRVTLTMD
jgi:hypothetical protein